jgi:hypothetical protein
MKGMEACINCCKDCIHASKNSQCFSDNELHQMAQNTFLKACRKCATECEKHEEECCIACAKICRAIVSLS